MKDSTRIERTFDSAKKMRDYFYKQTLEKRKKEDREKTIFNIEKMDTETAISELNKYKALYKQTKYGIKVKDKEIEEYENNKIVREYLSLLSQKESLLDDKDLISDKISILEQKICNHDYIYLMTYPKKTKAYIPTFRCLSCGKSLIGFIRGDQKIVNEQYIEEDEDTFHGDLDEFIIAKYKYNELIEEGNTPENAINIVLKDFRKNHQKLTKSIKLIRK